MSQDPHAAPPTSPDLGVLSNFADLDLTSVDTNYPILASGLYPVNVTKAEVQKTKKGGHMLVLEMDTLADAVDKNGKAVPAGFKITHRTGLTPTERMDRDQIVKSICTILDSTLGEEVRKRINLGSFDLATLVNQQAMVRTVIEPEKDGFPESTRISRFIKKGESTGPTAG